MPAILEEMELDSVTEEVDAALDDAEERAISEWSQQTPSSGVGDLTDGGIVGGVRVWPAGGDKPQRGQAPQKGRPNSRRAWMWNGAPGVIPLAWDTDGLMHDEGKRYLRKRFCLCCMQSFLPKRTGRASGRLDNRCPSCVKKGCTKCEGGNSTKVQRLPNGKEIQGWVISCFYLNLANVPFPNDPYGPVDCVMPAHVCGRRGEYGFKTAEEMRLHASLMHKVEYQAHRDAEAASRKDELEALKEHVSTMTASMLSRQVQAEQASIQDPEFLAWKAKKANDAERMARARAGIKRKSPVTIQ